MARSIFGGSYGERSRSIFGGSSEPDAQLRAKSEIERTRLRLSAVGEDAGEPRRFNPLTSILSGLERLDAATARPIARALTGGQAETFREAATQLGLSDDPLFRARIGPVQISPSAAGVAEFIGNMVNPLNPINLLTFGTGSAVAQTARGAARAAPRIVARASLPFSRQTLGEVAIPGSEHVVEATQAVGRALAGTQAGQALGRAFSTRFVPRNLPAHVPLRQLGDSAEEALVVSGQEAFRDIAEGLREVQTQFRPKAEDLRTQTAEIFRGISKKDRERITAAVSRDAIDTLPEHLRGPARAFQGELESIIKAERDAGIPIDALERYVPFVPVRTLTREEANLLRERFGTGVRPLLEPQDDLFKALSKINPHMRVRTTKSFSPDEVNKVLGKRWLEEDAAELLARRSIRSARVVDMKMYFDGVIAKYGLEVENAEEFLSKNLSGSVGDWMLVRPRVTKSGSVELAEVSREELGLIQRAEAAKTAATEAYRGGQSFRTLSKQAERESQKARAAQEAVNKERIRYNEIRKELLEAQLNVRANPDNEDLIKKLFKAENAAIEAESRMRRLTMRMERAAQKAEEARELARNAERESRQATRAAVTRSEQFTKAAGKRIDEGQPVLLPKEIVMHLNNYTRGFFNDEATNEFVRLFDRIQNIWKGHATVVRPGFHIRNAISNVYQNWLGGLDNPRWYAEALNIQRNPEQYAEIWEEVRRLGVVGADFVSTELGGSTVREMLDPSLARAFNPLSPEFVLTKYGGKVGKFIEDNARLAMYLFRRASGDAPEQAAATVKKYLFDYYDLTPFERNVMKRILPFYTWSRKNIPLQIEQAIKQPRRLAQLGRVQRGVGGEQPPSSEVPSFLEQSGAVLLPGTEGERIYVSPGLPVADLNMLPLTRDAMRDWMGSMSPLITTIPQLAMNRRFFSDQEIAQYEGQQLPLPGINAIAQMLGREEGVRVPAGLAFILGQLPLLQNLESQSPENPRRGERAASMVSGLTIFSQPQAERIATFEERDRLRALLRALQDAGVEVPTSQELRASGKSIFSR